jgi:ribosomal protein S18 acetylase RimI-like enzyme
MLQFKIRPANLSDLPILLQFEQGVIQAERPFDDWIKADPVQYYNIEEMIVATHIELVVAECEEKVVGCGYARLEAAKHFLKNPVHAYLGFMYVDPEYRGMGINKMVIETLKSWVLSRGVSELRLDVYYGNSPAIKAYEKVGFSKQLINMHMDLNKD